MRRYTEIIIIALLFASCRKPETYRPVAQKHCSGCHLFPEPALLPASAWKTVLFRMGLYFGIEDEDLIGDDRRAVKHRKLAAYLAEKQLIPRERTMAAQTWRQIREFYEGSAPRKTTREKAEFRYDLKLFREKSLFQSLPADAWIYPVRYLPPGVFYVGDILRGRLYKFSTAGEKLDEASFPSPVIAIRGNGNDIFLGLIGHLPPSDHTDGMIVRTGRNDPLSRYSVILRDLYRMADFNVSDLNGDGRGDFVVSGFGNYFGRFSLFTARGGGYSERILHDQPGAVMNQLADLDGDGRTDIVSLVSQGEEKIIVYHNLGRGNFSPGTVFQAPPSWGFVRLYLLDYNKDGLIDFLTVNGDNGDIAEKPVRNYHGIRIFRGEKDGSFRPALFYNMPGAFDAVAADFDGDGDEDIAAVANYPEFDSPENFVYLENTGAGWVAHHLKSTETMELGSIEKGDFDGDGDIDLFIGGRNTGKFPGQKMIQLYLENTRR